MLFPTPVVSRVQCTVEVLPDGTVLATTYGHWDAGKPPYIVSVRFTLAETDRRLSTGR